MSDAHAGVEFISLIAPVALAVMLTAAMLELQTSLAHNKVEPVLVRSVCEVARFLGKVTVAEWVEDRTVIDRFPQLGVDPAQGYGIREPCALEELIGMTPVLQSA